MYPAPEVMVSLEATSFADRLVDRRVAGLASDEELIEAEVDAPTIIRALLLARRAAARAPGDRTLADRCRILAELYETLRAAALQSVGISRWGGSIVDNYRSREEEVIDLVRRNGGYRTWETLPGRLPRQQPAVIRDRVRAFKMLAIGNDLRSALYPSAQFLPSGHVVLGLDQIAMALGTRERLAIIAFLFTADAGIRGFLPIELLREGRIGAVVALARDRM